VTTHRTIALCLWICCAGPRVASADLYVTVDQWGGGDATSITDALALVPPAPLEPVLIEILDDEAYYETVVIDKTTTATTPLTLAAATGASPTIYGQTTYQGAIQVSSPYTTIRGLIVVACSCSGGSGINIQADHVTVEQCTVSSALSPNADSDPLGGVNIVAGGAFVRHNVICGNDSGIRVYDYPGDDAVIRNNLVFGNLYRGIWMYRETNGNQVYNNTLHDNGFEIQLGHGGNNYDPGGSNEFFSNVLAADNGGYGFVVDQDGDPMTLPNDTLLDWNLYFANPGYGFPARLDGTTYFDFADWQTASSQEVYGVWGDPLFTDAANNDYTTSLASPVVDAGNPLALYDDVDGSFNDIGAYGGPDPFPVAGPVTGCGVVVVDEDGDGDGYVDVAFGGDDCDDSDAAVNPGAAEVACDYIDNDCDSALHADEVDDDGDGYDECNGDCDDGDALLDPADADGDGLSSCDGDCDDGDPLLNLDDVDQDGFTTCDGDCDDLNNALDLADADGDGSTTCDGDCDDGDAAVNPDVPEDCKDLIDNDCDGDVDTLDSDCEEHADDDDAADDDTAGDDDASDDDAGDDDVSDDDAGDDDTSAEQDDDTVDIPESSDCECRADSPGQRASLLPLACLALLVAGFRRRR